MVGYVKYLLGFGILALILMAGCSGPAENFGGQGILGSQVSPSVENAQVGETYQVSYPNSRFNITLNKTGVECIPPMYGGKCYFVAYFEVMNTGDRSGFLNAEVYASDQYGKRYGDMLVLGLVNQSRYTQHFGSPMLAPGEKAGGWVEIGTPQDLNRFDLYMDYYNDPNVSSIPKHIRWPMTR